MTQSITCLHQKCEDQSSGPSSQVHVMVWAYDLSAREAETGGIPGACCLAWLADSGSRIVRNSALNTKQQNKRVARNRGRHIHKYTKTTKPKPKAHRLKKYIVDARTLYKRKNWASDLKIQFWALLLLLHQCPNWGTSAFWLRVWTGVGVKGYLQRAGVTQKHLHRQAAHPNTGDKSRVLTPAEHHSPASFSPQFGGSESPFQQLFIVI